MDHYLERSRVMHSQILCFTYSYCTLHTQRSHDTAYTYKDINENSFKQSMLFGKRNVVESFRFHPTLILFYLKESVL